MPRPIAETMKATCSRKDLAGTAWSFSSKPQHPGASVYSASAFASQELPDLDVTVRGAVSIARRLQDPLAELVKIDPKSIGARCFDGRPPIA
jgi:hypothetical protein